MTKRLIDILVALFVLIMGAPFILLCAVLVFLSMGRPILFKQQRPGYLGKPFILYKYRTMRDTLGSDDQALPDHKRLSYVGRLLRRTSLDELPQLINVLRGDMSLVGPRPLLMEYLSLYNDRHIHRHDLKPGITGWAQVNGRNAITWEEKFELDIWYVKNQTFWLDIRIMWMTAKKVVIGKDIFAEGEVTMSKFNGYRK